MAKLASWELSATRAQPEEIVSEAELVQLAEKIGGPRRTRTCNPLIKSQLLYH